MTLNLFLARMGRVGLALGLAGMLMLPGCAWWKGGQQVKDAPAGEQEVWSIRPVRMRVYPSSRFVEDAGQAIFEARVELLDEMGDSIKDVGWYHFELYAGARGGAAQIGRRLYSWDVPVLTLVQQQRHFDPITRAYLFRLKLDNMDPAREGLVFQATFTPAKGQRLDAQVMLGGGESLMGQPGR